ncbi:MAG: glutaminyl-peptide cyclotransferase [Nonlabens sp.]
MHWKKAIFFVTIILSITACKTEEEIFTNNFKLVIENDKSAWKSGDEVRLSLKDEGDLGMDSIVWSQNARKIEGGNGVSLSRKLTKNDPIGILTYKAHIYKNGRKAVAKASIKRLNPKKPVIYKYRKVNAYPHSPESYTQGLEFYGDSLYESTGQFRESDIRITNVETGETVKKVDLPGSQFAEGMTIMNDKVYQLTWQSQIGYVYDLGLNKIDEFAYNESKEGWGLTNDGKKLYKSDGTDKIWIINPETYEEEGYIQIVSNKKVFKKINELEYIDGKIYANIYQENAIMIVDPSTGALEGVVAGLSALTTEIPNYSENDNVLNGIAYDKKNNRLFVTGKRWEKMFEIEILK